MGSWYLGQRLLGRRPLAAWAGACTEASFMSVGTRSFSQATSNQEIYGACVLERLPIVQQPAPEWEAEYRAWLQQRREQQRLIKSYPAPEGKKAASRGPDPEDDFVPVPSVTKADKSGETSTMKRQLASKLVLLVKQQQSAAGTPGSGSWTFPHTRHKEGETIRATAERALKECIGAAQVYFIGNAPMAHLRLGQSAGSSSSGSSKQEQTDAPTTTATATSSSSSEGGGSKGGTSSSSSRRAGPTLFFHLAQVVNDPWEVQLKDPAAATAHAWVTPEELPQYIQDARLLDLAKRML